MFATQLSVFVENKVGRLSEILNTFGEHHIDIRALSIAENSEFGILRLIVSETERAYDILKREGYIVKKTEVLSLPMDDKPGALAKLVDKLSEAGIGIEYLYAFVSRDESGANVVLRLDDPEKAAKLFK